MSKVKDMVMRLTTGKKKNTVPNNVVHLSEFRATIIHLTIERAFKAYKEGKIGPWDLQAVIEKCGYFGWTGTPDGKLIVHTAAPR